MHVPPGVGKAVTPTGWGIISARYERRSNSCARNNTLALIDLMGGGHLAFTQHASIETRLIFLVKDEIARDRERLARPHSGPTPLGCFWLSGCLMNIIPAFPWVFCPGVSLLTSKSE
ncbi:uncharacterized protein DSM5745_03977 [Aspergillus mulundensis]|uniref:Uncharacterized protein n=1 Tax=Aspergillus mulundensis TaxID=1810919 RepID=A0A3D8SBT8_9EURO|nr:hypothetical protein DSM5745_03977 [Aspergillus mulundensis]RDW83651.1 hypothetical protein DSM5745_03977 [Aspergillus mulundensis]